MDSTDLAPTTSRDRSDVDISTWDFWRRPFEERDASFARLRAEPTLTWHPPMDTEYPHDEQGFWAAVRIADIARISKDHQAFSSASGWTVDPLPTGVKNTTGFILGMDPPEHTFYRRLISAAFTPRQVAKLQEEIEQAAREIVGDLVGAGDVDFVSACSAQLPMRTVSDMIGIPEADRPPVARAAEAMFNMEDDSVRGGKDIVTYMQEQIATLHDAAVEVAADRRVHPRDDLMTNIVQAEVDGRGLTDEQIGAFMVLLSTAGSDTTKQTTSHGIWALSRFPEQRAWLVDDFEARIGTAVEELVRFASPVLAFARIALRDTEVGGVRIREGEKVGMFYCSGNRDETVFTAPGELDLSRGPNPHVGFGGGGAHYCLGTNVARMQLRALFRELLLQVPDLQVGDPHWLISRHMHGIGRLPASFPKRSAVGV